MRVIRFDDSQAFAQRVTPFLMRDEAENCFYLGIMPSLKPCPQTLMAAVEDVAGNVAAVAIKTPDRHVMITSAPAEANDALARHIVERRFRVPGVQSRREVVERFARLYCDATGATPRVRFGMAVHQLDHVNPLPAVAGSMRPLDEHDVDFYAAWVLAFARETHHETPDDFREIAIDRIARRRAFAWCVNGTTVSTACLAGPTPNGIRISLVYTPTEHRRHGYASALVAALSRRMLDEGRSFCFLYTDLANPTSNKIYRAIGYRQVCEDLVMFFDHAEPEQHGR